MVNFNYCNYKHIETMEYQKTINLLDKTNNQQSRFKTKNWFMAKDKSCERYNPCGE